MTTRNDLQRLAAALNRAHGTPQDMLSVGSYIISECYVGSALHQIAGEDGEVDDVLDCGFTSRSNLSENIIKLLTTDTRERSL